MIRNNIKSVILAIAVLMATALAGCTRNNGDIGPLFGRWSVEHIEGVNMEPPQCPGSLFLAFQNDVVQMTETGDEHRSESCYGTFRVDDNTLFMDFNDPRYPLITSFGLPAHTALQILELKGKKLVLRYDATADKSLIYALRRW